MWFVRFVRGLAIFFVGESLLYGWMFFNHAENVENDKKGMSSALPIEHELYWI